MPHDNSSKGPRLGPPLENENLAIPLLDFIGGLEQKGGRPLDTDNKTFRDVLRILSAWAQAGQAAADADSQAVPGGFVDPQERAIAQNAPSPANDQRPAEDFADEKAQEAGAPNAGLMGRVADIVETKGDALAGGRDLGWKPKNFQELQGKSREDYSSTPGFNSWFRRGEDPEQIALANSNFLDQLMQLVSQQEAGPLTESEGKVHPNAKYRDPLGLSGENFFPAQVSEVDTMTGKQPPRPDPFNELEGVDFLTPNSGGPLGAGPPLPVVGAPPPPTAPGTPPQDGGPQQGRLWPFWMEPSRAGDPDIQGMNQTLMPEGPAFSTDGGFVERLMGLLGGKPTPGFQGGAPMPGVQPGMQEAAPGIGPGGMQEAAPSLGPGGMTPPLPMPSTGGMTAPPPMPGGSNPMDFIRAMLQMGGP